MAHLTKVLTYHVVAGRLTPEMLTGTHTTLNGATLTIAGSGEDFTVNGKAKVVCVSCILSRENGTMRSRTPGP